MFVNIGEKIVFRTLPKGNIYEAKVIDRKEDNISIEHKKDFKVNFPMGQSFLIYSNGMDYYTEVIEANDKEIKFKYIGHEPKEFFRVEDALPLIVKKVQVGVIKGRIITEYGLNIPDLIAYGEDVPDETINPILWKMLINLNVKLGLLLDRVTLGSEGLTSASYKNVELSASGIRAIVDEEFNKDDKVEIKMLLPVSPPIGIVVYGIVVWSKKMEDGNYAVAISYAEIEENVREELIQYTLKRQREILRKQRGL
ncbi:Type IV pilus assembly PilZ domain protein [Candidatus Magnetoovum chiemensis]|nr:Type IV pilus assembly PilZ domain protein [Candidatus Magnetoovum chiemensis]